MTDNLMMFTSIIDSTADGRHGMTAEGELRTSLHEHAAQWDTAKYEMQKLNNRCSLHGRIDEQPQCKYGKLLEKTKMEIHLCCDLL